VTERKTYRARWVLTDPWTVLENGHVTVAGGRIESIGTGRPPSDSPVMDLGPGVLMPPLVNAHTHLELSALSGMLPFDRGFRQWTAALVEKRAGFSETVLLEEAQNAVQLLLGAGCAAVAEVSTLGTTRSLLGASGLGGVFFQEHLGGGLPENPGFEKALPLSSSLAAHAPHTTAPDLIRMIHRETSSRGLPMSIHLSESEDESQFIQTARGDWADFLSERGIDFSGWPLSAASPVRYLESLGVLDAGTLAVHLLTCSGQDMRVLREHNVSVCFCPRSNYLLHGDIPDIPEFLSIGFQPCLGTDSLASCPSLSVLDEMAFISSRYESVSPPDIIAMGTVYGAAALGIEDRFGRLAPGFAAPPFHVPIEAGTSSDVPGAVVRAGNPHLAVGKGISES